MRALLLPAALALAPAAAAAEVIALDCGFGPDCVQGAVCEAVTMTRAFRIDTERSVDAVSGDQALAAGPVWAILSTAPDLPRHIVSLGDGTDGLPHVAAVISWTDPATPPLFGSCTRAAS